MEFEEGDVVLCTVDRIVGTVVFVKIEGNGEGSIIMSEIAPGRIRNLRDYVVPKKKIVCKIIRISKTGHIDLSLRRVSQKESKEVIGRAKEEQSFIKILRSISGNNADNIIEKIKEKDNLYDFFQNARENPEELGKIMEKKDSQKILEILNAQKKKKNIVKKEIYVSSINPDGINDIKNTLKNANNAKIKYISGGKYTIETEAKDIKTADNELRKILEEIEKRAKNNQIDFSIKEK